MLLARLAVAGRRLRPGHARLAIRLSTRDRGRAGVVGPVARARLPRRVRSEALRAPVAAGRARSRSGPARPARPGALGQPLVRVAGGLDSRQGRAARRASIDRRMVRSRIRREAAIRAPDVWHGSPRNTYACPAPRTPAEPALARPPAGAPGPTTDREPARRATGARPRAVHQRPQLGAEPPVAATALAPPRPPETRCRSQQAQARERPAQVRPVGRRPGRGLRRLGRARPRAPCPARRGGRGAGPPGALGPARGSRRTDGTGRSAGTRPPPGTGTVRGATPRGAGPRRGNRTRRPAGTRTRRPAGTRTGRPAGTRRGARPRTGAG